MSRLLALDVGNKRTGIAVSDELGLTARPLETVPTERLEVRLSELLAEHQTATIVVGRPRHLGGELGEQAGKIDRIVDSLKGVVAAQFVYEDETATSVDSKDDAEAAATILRGYLTERANPAPQDRGAG